MNLARNTIFILIALFIDGLQATISWGIATIAAFPATTAGGTVGCVVGSQAAGQLGCWIGGVVLGILGTSGNVFLAPFTIPAGIAIGLAVNITLSATLGWAFLVPLMYTWGVKTSWQRLALGGGEMIPGINNVPFWTALTFASLWGGAVTKKARKGILGIATVAVAPVRGIMRLQEQAGVSQSSPPTSGRELIRASEKQLGVPLQRTPMRDIRSTKPNAQAT